jgi:hypothetical protein
MTIYVNSGGPSNGSCWYILSLFGLFYGHLVHFMVIWSIFHALVCCTKKNLATLNELVIDLVVETQCLDELKKIFT